MLLSIFKTYHCLLKFDKVDDRGDHYYSPFLSPSTAETLLPFLSLRHLRNITDALRSCVRISDVFFHRDLRAKRLQSVHDNAKHSQGETASSLNY